MPRTIAIGDIHGCAKALDALLDAIQPGQEDRIICLGDLIDRGDQSKEVIDRLLKLRGECELVVVMGNHEEMLLQVMDGEMPWQEWIKHGGVQTLESYGFTGQLDIIPTEHIDLMRNAVQLFETESHFFTHGNYDAKKPLDQQDAFKLRWVSLIESTPKAHQSGKKAVLGHTPDKHGEIFDIGHLVCIDTYCYGGMWLTAMDVENNQVWQASPEGELR